MDLFSRYAAVISKADADSYFAKCGFVACNNGNEVFGNGLIVGINPSRPVNGQYIPTPSFAHPWPASNVYFSKLGRFIPEIERGRTGYLDLFPFYEQFQETLLHNIRGNESFIASVLAVSQEEIERISPSLIIVANKSLIPYWGAASDCVWMGYDFMPLHEDCLPESLRGRNLDIRIIKGFRHDLKTLNEIIYHPVDGICRLKGTVVLFYRHSRGIPSKDMLTEQDYSVLLHFAKKVKSTIQ